jgi:hypothetical protein
MHIDVSTVDADLIEMECWIPFALVELFFQVELHFQVSIPLDEVSVESFRTIRGIAEIVDDQAGSERGERG